MVRFSGAAAVIAICLPVALLAADAHQLTPGRWQVQRKMVSGTLAGSPLPLEALKSGEETKFVCISAEEAREPRAYFLKAGTKGQCGTPTGEVAGGQLKFSGSCGGPNGGKVQIDLVGSYGRSEYRMTGTGKMIVQNQPMAFDMLIEGRYVGVCKGDETE